LSLSKKTSARNLEFKTVYHAPMGTDALYIAMRALGLTREDEVITTAHSWDFYFRNNYPSRRKGCILRYGPSNL